MESGRHPSCACPVWSCFISVIFHIWGWFAATVSTYLASRSCLSVLVNAGKVSPRPNEWEKDTTRFHSGKKGVVETAIMARRRLLVLPAFPWYRVNYDQPGKMTTCASFLCTSSYEQLFMCICMLFICCVCIMSKCWTMHLSLDTILHLVLINQVML